ncbi:MAG: ABC transporter permease, partial [Gracilibacteraceae bacterium]|nr:ABC transporter permease [Gracilibacteraceae bacterium]
MKRMISDTLVMSGRVAKQLTRSVDTVITVLIMPIMMLLAFVYVFGSDMKLDGIGAADYMLPGAMLMAVMSGVAYTGYRLHMDIRNGIFERFRSLPVARSSILGGHVAVSVVSNLVSVYAVVLAGLLIGFRPQASFAQWLLATVLVLLFVTALTYVAVFFGTVSKSPETVGIFSYVLIALGFVSSSFAPISSMPGGLAAFARYNPMSAIADSIRLLLLGQSPGNRLWLALAWCVIVSAV